MSEQPNNSSDSLERLLGRWGADRAVRESPLPAMPAKRGRRPVVVTLARWAPLAAAAMLFIASAVMFVGGPWRQHAGDSVAVTSFDDGAEKKERMAGAAAADADEPTEMDSHYAYEAELIVVRQERDALAEELAQLKLAMSVAPSAPAPVAEPEARGRWAARRDSFDAEPAEVDDDAAALESLGYVDGYVVDGSLRESASLLSDDGPTLVRMYLSMVAPDDAGLQAVQVAVRKRELIERCHRLQLRLADSEYRGLLDRVEVVLTQTEMVSADDPEQVAGLVSLSRSGSLREALADALAEVDDMELREFLFEVQIIMEAVDGVA